MQSTEKKKLNETKKKQNQDIPWYQISVNVAETELRNLRNSQQHILLASGEGWTEVANKNSHWYNGIKIIGKIDWIEKFSWQRLIKFCMNILVIDRWPSIWDLPIEGTKFAYNNIIKLFF